MRFPLAVLLSVSLSSSTAFVAAEQVPIMDKAAGWFDKAKNFVADSIPHPIDAAAAAIAEKNVEKINVRNYERKLQPKLEGEEEWLVFLTGGNKSCFGRCARANAAWNESAAILSALPQPAGAAPMHLAKLDCESDYVLCTGWAASVPSIYHFIFPAKSTDPNTPTPKTPLRIIELNASSVTAADMVKVARAAPDSVYPEYPTYTGMWHPVDGWMAKLGLQYYIGYVIMLTGTTPSWLIMLVISFFSRQYMGRRAYQNRPAGAVGGGNPAPPAAVPPPPAAVGRGTPGSAGKGGKKRK